MAIRAAIVEAGVVVNVIMLDDLGQWPGSVAGDGVNIGDAYDGEVFTPPAPAVVNLADAVSSFIKKVDIDVDAIYAAAMGNRTTEYTLAEADAKAFVDAGYAGTVPASVQAWATAKGQTATWAADDVLTTATAWRGAQAAIRADRLLRKEQARVAVDAEELAVVISGWNGFVVFIRGQLGIA